MRSDIQSVLDTIVLAEEIPGASLAIAGPEGKTYTFCSGLADKESQIPMNDQHFLFSGSIGKTYVAAVVMQLMEEDLISLDEPVRNFFEGEAWFERVPNSGEITIQMLLNHTSGIPRYVFKDDLWNQVREDPYRSWTGEERMGFVLDDEPLHAAGKNWGYSDTNYILLGMVVEKVTGLSFKDNLVNRLLVPLKLENTRPAEVPYLPGLASGYTAFSEDFHLPVKMYENGRYAINPQLEWTGGGMVSTPADLAEWASTLYGSDLIPEPYHTEMKTSGPWPTQLGEDVGYGFATFIWPGVVPRYGHTGFMFGYMAIVEYLPASDIAIALQLNCDRLPEGDKIADYTERVREIIVKYEN